MASEIDRLKWELHNEKKTSLFKKGIMEGRIVPYDAKLIGNLRYVYYDNIPASIWLLCKKKCDRFCYHRALLLSLGFGKDEFQLIDADIDSLMLNPDIIDEVLRENDGKLVPHYGNHRFVLRKMADGTTWVYDTSRGLVFEKELYFQIERPKITRVISKEEVVVSEEYQSLKNSKLNREAVPVHLPEFEALANEESLYQGPLKREIEFFKLDIDYDEIGDENYGSLPVGIKF